MAGIRICDDIEECRFLWEHFWPAECIFDLWPVRYCFAEPYGRRPCFIIAEQNGILQGILALSWIEEDQYYGQFPGETCNGKTWLEQNRIPAKNPHVTGELLSAVPGPVHVRYLSDISFPEYSDNGWFDIDETGYLFLPGDYNYSLENYFQQFSGKTRKKLRHELSRLEKPGVEYRHDSLRDVEDLYRLNLHSFGEQSYFSSSRFLRSFENLVSWLNAKGMLRVTTALIGGKTAAVDIGAVLGLSYVVLAGGTHPDFPGVAKLINFHHMEWACQQHFESVDFLCGDFGWKERFHLTPRPLYEIKISEEQVAWQEGFFEESIACVQ
ncbi:MAG: GNAT family N-acetyltransferase [Deltaproteobacteria bacterium]|nr:GNAT family N-acetyltransferase [Deltaproteobacteria bacterium]